MSQECKNNAQCEKKDEEKHCENNEINEPIYVNNTTFNIITRK